MNVVQVTTAVTAYVIWGWRGLVIELWANTILVGIGCVIADRRKRTDYGG